MLLTAMSLTADRRALPLLGDNGGAERPEKAEINVSATVRHEGRLGSLVRRKFINCCWMASGSVARDQPEGDTCGQVCDRYETTARSTAARRRNEILQPYRKLIGPWVEPLSKQTVVRLFLTRALVFMCDI
jgi:hypothetical protein